MAGQSDASAGYLESVLRHYFSLDPEDHCGSVRLLGDLLIANSRPLGLCNHGDQFARVLLVYADSLYFDLQFRRALHFYEEALRVVHSIALEQTAETTSEAELKWKMYKCHMKLRERQEAFDMLISIPLKQRDSRVALALGKLYHHFKNEKQEAKICYKQALSMAPLTLEAVVNLLSLGVGLQEVLFTARSLHSEEESGALSPGTWLFGWLEAQAYIAKHEFNGAVSKIEAMSQQGFVVSAEINSQLGICQMKLGRTDAAKELFAMTRAQDPYTLTHMDTYSRLLTDDLEQQSLTTALLYASPHHTQPWVAKAWEVVRRNYDPLKSNINVILQKANSIDPRNAELSFLQGTVLKMKSDSNGALKKFIEAIQIDPTFFEAFEIIVEHYCEFRQAKDGLALIRTTGRKLPPSQQYFLEGLALSKENTNKAKLLLERSIKSEPTFDKAVIKLAQLLFSEKNEAKAVDILTTQLQLHASAALHCELGDCLTRLKRLTQAEDHYRQALRLSKAQGRAQTGLLRINRYLSAQEHTFEDPLTFSEGGDNIGSDDSLQDWPAENFET